MLEGLVAAGFYSSFYENKRRAVLAGAGAAALVLVVFWLTELQYCGWRTSWVLGLHNALPLLTTLWLMFTGFLFQGKQSGQREQMLLMGGVWLIARSLGGLCVGSAMRQTEFLFFKIRSLQAVIATALFAMGILYLLGRGKLYPMWAAALAILWLLTGFLGSIVYAEAWQQQAMTASLFLVAGGTLVFQQISCTRQNLEKATWQTKAGMQISAYSDSAGGWMESAGQEYQRLQIFEHDFRHHLDVVAALYEEGSAAEARAYMEDIKQARVSRQGLKVGGERELSYIMMAKREACRQAQISFSYQIVGSPRGIAQMDMTALLLNLLDNAIRACQEMPKPRSISVMLLARGELWEIELTNSGQYKLEEAAVEAESETESCIVPGTGIRTEAGMDAGRKIYGIGMISVRQIVDKYQGTYRIWQEEGQVRQKLILVQRGDMDL